MQVWGGLVTGLRRRMLRSWRKRAEGPGGELRTLVLLEQSSSAHRAGLQAHLLEREVLSTRQKWGALTL